jgi:hypothetical protein
MDAFDKYERRPVEPLLLVQQSALTQRLWLQTPSGRPPEGTQLSISPSVDYVWVIFVPSTFRHSRMKAARPVHPFAETMLPST